MKLTVYAATAALLLALVTPVFHPPPYDSYPFSTFPMFSRLPDSPEVTLAHVVTVAADGSRHAVAPALVGSDEVLQAKVIIRTSVEGGRAAELCRAVARRLGPFQPPIQAVEVRSDRYDVFAYFSGDQASRAGTVHARCGGSL